MANVVGGSMYQPSITIEVELDRRRQYFTEELVKMGIEELSFESFSDTHKVISVEGRDCTSTEPTLTLEGWYLAVTKAAKAAAEELYPELPEEEDANAQ